MVQQNYEDNAHGLQDLIHGALARSPYFSNRNITFEMRDEEVILKGVVRTYYQKQIAQESLRAIDGINLVRNELQVATR